MRAALAFLSLSLCFVVSQALASQTTSSSSVQVLYVGDGSNLYTYNIDPQTLQPTLAGSIPYPAPFGYQLVTSSNGHFLYFLASTDNTYAGNRIYVYDTDSNGVPGKLLQSVRSTSDYSLTVDSHSDFLYAVHMGKTVNLQTPYSIYRYLVDSDTGKLAHVLKVATYILPSDVSGADCGLEIAGMNPSGTKIYDDVVCNNHDSNSGTYDRRTINAQTGALGSPQEIFTWTENMEGGDTVQFIGSRIFDFAEPIIGIPINSVLVYPLKPNSTKATVNCYTGSCATDSGIAHPSGKYVFLTDPTQNTTEVDAVNMSSKQIVPTGTVFANPSLNILFFSPDGSLVYSLDRRSGTVSVSGFNSSDAVITTGGAVSESQVQNWLAVERR